MKTHHYLIHIQYLGFRYHGWQKQPGVNTIESMIEKTLGFVLKDEPFKLMGASRTDARVSANHSTCMLFSQKIRDMDQLKTDLNVNLPNDIRVTRIEKKDPGFNIINSPRIKEYLYLFAFGGTSHPFSAALMHTLLADLDIDLMKKGARLFEGRHNFIRYCTQPRANTRLERQINLCRVEENTAFQANFFPQKSYALRIRSKGFLRNQIRLIMGQLFELGQKKISLADIQTSLLGRDTQPLRQIAPASGLILNQIIFKE